MPDTVMREAVARGLREALDRDDKTFLMGEDIGAYGGAYAVTRGFLEEYGSDRIKDTPISESVIVGAAIGAAMGGSRPIVEIMTINFSLLAMDPDRQSRRQAALHVQRTDVHRHRHSDGHGEAAASWEPRTRRASRAGTPRCPV